MILQEGFPVKPALIITYARPKNCMKLIDSLLAQGCKRLYIAIDFGKDNIVASSQIEYDSLKIRYENKFERFKIWRRTENLGVAVSVITALDWFFKNEDSGAILEDDLEISSDFLRFMSNGLEELRSHENIFSISGSNFFPNETQKNFLTSYFIGWGWGTWKDRWEKAKPVFLSEVNCPSFSLDGVSNFWNIGAYRCKIGAVDTWDLELTKHIRDNRFLNVIAASNLVSNVGFDSNSTNTREEKFPLRLPLQELSVKHKFFENLAVNSSFDTELEDKVFGIKLRHKFLHFVYHKHHMKPFMQKISLPKRLQNVIIP